MEAPETIYVGLEDVGSGYVWNISILDNGMEQYIRKDALLEWAKERYQQTVSNVGCYTGNSVWKEVIEKLESL